MPSDSDLQGTGCSPKGTPREGGGRGVTHKRGCDSLCIRGIKSLINWVVMPLHLRFPAYWLGPLWQGCREPPGAVSSATLHLPDAQNSYCASRTAARPATQPRPVSICPRGAVPSGPAGPTHRLHGWPRLAVTSAADLAASSSQPAPSLSPVNPLVHPPGRRRGTVQQPIISSLCFFLRALA